jgi:hypothetical protein
MWESTYRKSGTAPDGIVYAVGKYGKVGGFDDEIKDPLIGASPGDQAAVAGKLQEAVRLHLLGLHNVVQLLRFLEPGSSLAVLSSAITRFTPDQLPPEIHAGHYLTATTAKDMLVECLRCDPTVCERGLLIHRLAFGAVDTPFHRDCKHTPSVMLPVKFVANQVVAALASDEVVDKQFLPEE